MKSCTLQWWMSLTIVVCVVLTGGWASAPNAQLRWPR